MKRCLFWGCFLLLFFPRVIIAQDSCLFKIKQWMSNNNISIRKTFDGSKNEKKPASIAFWDDHLKKNDFFNIDMGIKISEFEIPISSTSLIFYPKVEWHKSTDSSDLKNKIDAGINIEFIPFQLKSPGQPDGQNNRGLPLSPWFQGTSSIKRNFIDKVYETKIIGQLSLVGNYKFMPGYLFRDRNLNLLGYYYPYLGFEYNYLPDLITKDKNEEFSTFFCKIFIDFWALPQTLQIILEGTYRRILTNSSLLKKDMPLFSGSLNFYPGKQDNISIGYEYKNGYDTDNKFQLLNLSSLKFNIQF